MPNQLETSDIESNTGNQSENLLDDHSINLNKKYRHQNYSKNVYIGTKNAEKWDIIRTKFSFKNDVEFVSYLLKLAEQDFLTNGNIEEDFEGGDDGRSHTVGGNSNHTTSTFPIRLEQNLNEKYFSSGTSDSTGGKSIKNSDSKLRYNNKRSRKNPNDDPSNSSYPVKNPLPLPPAPLPRSNPPVLSTVTDRQTFSKHRKSTNKTHKQKTTFSILNQNSQDAQDNSISSTNEPFTKLNGTGLDNQDDLLPEVLDCRIAEKIKNELEQKMIVENAAWNNEQKNIKSNDKCSSQSSFDDNVDEHLETSALCLTKDESKQSQDCLDRKSHKKQKRKTKSGKLERRPSVDGPTDQPVDKPNVKIRIKKFNDYSTRLPAVDPYEYNELDDIPDKNLNSNEDEDDDFDDNEEDFDDDEEDYGLIDESDLFESEPEGNDEEMLPADDDDLEDVTFHSNCRYCLADHTPDECPILLATEHINDSITFSKWKSDEDEKHLKDENATEIKSEENDVEKCTENNDMEDSSYCHLSLPSKLEIRSTEVDVGVFTKESIKQYTKMGPLIGSVVKQVDLSDDCLMRNIWEMYDGIKSTFISTDNKNDSNWMRLVKPAERRDARNLALVHTEDKLYFVTVDDINKDTELLYWSDDCNSAWGKKKSERMNCGGCNLKFEHPLYYRTHCSVFHDPSFSLTIRKYHCKICGSVVLGKENIMKHAAQMHDGKGAYQCQFCQKYFLRLNYLEMHRTYGCSANPQRARPLCDFCGRKFCQPQKLKVHIKRMHSDMADVLRDFQCKMCSKLLGSRAALQRHSKEVHSRNSAVVSCPRCQKLFQNRSNLKIHMLTHSGVRPFKCAEIECNAAFTTKQCLQFHYKKVHNYAQEKMPKIERSVAYTFDAYSGGMKVEYLEQAPRRRRKSLDDQSTVLGSTLLDTKSETDFSDDNIIENIKKSGKSLTKLYKHDPSLSIFSSKINSMLDGGGKIKQPKKRGRRPKVSITEKDNKSVINHHDLLSEYHRRNVAALGLNLGSTANNPNANGDLHTSVDNFIDDKNQEEFLQTLKQRHQQNKQLSLIESFLSTATAASAAGIVAAAASRINESQISDEHCDISVRNDITDHLTHNNNNEDDYRLPTAISIIPTNINKLSEMCLNPGQSLIASKGSRKWISTSSDLRDNNLNKHDEEDDNEEDEEDEDDDDDNCESDIQEKLDGNLPGRDFLSRLILNGAQQTADDDENSSFLDVVDSNNGQACCGPSNLPQLSINNQNQIQNVTSENHHLPHLQQHLSNLHNSQPFIGPFYNSHQSNGTNSNRIGSNSVLSTSASMLVEAALNSVGNMIPDDDVTGKTNNNDNDIDGSDMAHQGSIDMDMNDNIHHSQNDRFNSLSSTFENEIKMMKNISNFPLGIPSMAHFDAGTNTSNTSTLNPNQNGQLQSPAHDTNLPQDNDIDVDTASTPRTVDPTEKLYHDNETFGCAQHSNATPTPQPAISPNGQDFPSMYSSGNHPHNNNSNDHNIASSPLPLPSIMARRTFSDQELISPPSSPPRYGFGVDMCRKRNLNDQQQVHPHQINSTHHQANANVSSDEENSIMAQNLSMDNHSASTDDLRIKFNQPQLDLMYNKYDSGGSTADLTDIRSKYVEHMEMQNFRGNDNLSDIQGLDMSSRGTSFHHNFQLGNSSNLNLGRYHHHIYDILSEREQQLNQQQQHHQIDQQHHLQSHQHMQHLLQEQMLDHESDQTTSVDLSRSANYGSPSPQQTGSSGTISYPHHPSDMLRMSSLDLQNQTAVGNGNLVCGGASMISNRPFLQSQINQSTDHHRYLTSAEQHRLMATNSIVGPDQIATNHRLLVDSAAHLLMEQNSRLLGGTSTTDQARLLDSTQNRHMVSPRGFGAYHPQANYHHSAAAAAVAARAVLPSTPVNPANYHHPFPTYY